MTHSTHENAASPPASNLEAVLAAWHTATVRLEKTHEVLRAQVGRLTDELEVKNRELARKNRLADLGQMASHVAHEVRNNLAPVALYLSLLRRRVAEDSGAVDILDKVESGVMSLDATVNDLLSFTAEREPRVRLTNVHRLLEDVLGSLALQLSAQEITATIDVPTDLSVSVDGEMLRRAVLNLSLNAVDAMPDGGELVMTSVVGRHGFELEVADTGDGFGEGVRERVFEPFFTTKSSGTGLGLAIVRRIAEVHGGEATARNCPEGGAALTIRIPLQTLEKAA